MGSLYAAMMRFLVGLVWSGLAYFGAVVALVGFGLQFVPALITGAVICFLLSLSEELLRQYTGGR